MEAENLPLRINGLRFDYPKGELTRPEVHPLTPTGTGNFASVEEQNGNLDFL